MLVNSLLASSGDDGAILIAGAGHVVKDRAVPFYLHLRQPKRSVLSIAFVEVIEGQTNPLDYVSGGEEAYDYIWFTPRTERIDQCEKLRQHFKTKKAK